MKKSACLSFITCLCVTMLSYCAYGQRDNVLSGKGVNTPIENYFNGAIGYQSRLINGSYYELHSASIEGNAYFMDIRNFSNGTVIYDGYRFENIPLIYDLFQGLIVTRALDDLSSFSLLSDRVTDVYLYDHHIVRIKADSTANNSPISTGFYDLVKDGKIKVLVKRAKTLQERLNINAVQKYFLSETSYFILKDNQYYKISSESSFMKLFKTEKAGFKKALKDQQIKFRKNPEQALIVLASYYDTLKN